MDGNLLLAQVAYVVKRARLDKDTCAEDVSFASETGKV